MNNRQRSIRPGGQITLYGSPRLTVYVYRPRQREELRLRVIGGDVMVTSQRVAFWGRDLNFISGPRGIWKIADDAPRNLANWIEAVR